MFLIDEAKSRLFTLNKPEDFLVSPMAATWIIAQDTFFGNEFYENAAFLLFHEPTIGDRRFWSDIDNYWSGYNQELLWTYLDRPMGVMLESILTH